MGNWSWPRGRWFGVFWVWCAAALLPAGEGLSAAITSQPRIRVQRDPETLVTTITIVARHGRVAWSDILAGLAQARGHDVSAVEGLLPAESFDLSRKRWRLALLGLNLFLRPGISFRVQPAAAGEDEPRLVITLNRQALLASKRRFQGLLRKAWSRRGPQETHYGLKLDPQWQKVAADRPLVVLVHGLNSRPEELETLADSLRRQALPCAMFSYPNDQPIDDSAQLLARTLAQLAEKHPQRRVALVTHSMGGLVCRAVVEDPKLDPGNVAQLIMIAPPNHGSGLARFGFGLELWDQLRGLKRREQTGMFYAWVEDGLSEAADDLQPDSPFLRRLNSHRRNPHVRYSIFLGTDAPLTEEELELLRRRIAAAGNRNRWVRFFGPQVDRWLADLDEVVEGKGDGVVSLHRGRLEGVEDTVILHFGHIGVLGKRSKNEVNKVHQGVLKRLQTSAASSQPTTQR